MKIDRSVSWLLIVPVTLALVGCGKGGSSDKGEDKDKDKNKGAKGKTTKAGGLDFAPWDLEAKKKAWQGSWVVMENGTVQAWTISGDQVKTWDGKEEKTFALKVTAPCRAYFTTGQGMMFPREFSIVGGKLRFRAGGAGYRRGKEALFCDMSGEIFVLDAGGKCTVWKDKFGEWSKADGECGFKKNAQGAEVFHHGGTNADDYALDGDAILAKTSFETLPASDHAAAKALRDEKSAK